jgi:protease I
MERKGVLMTRAVILTGPGFQDQELAFVFYRMVEEGWSVEVATKNGQPVYGRYGIPVPLDKTAKRPIPFEELNPDSFDVVVCTGGFEAPDRVRQEPVVRRFVADMAARLDRICVGLCHGSWIFVSADIMKGRKACAYVGMVDDMRNAGAELVDAPVIVDGNVITCSYYGYCGLALRAVIEAVAARQGNRSAPQGALATADGAGPGTSGEEPCP